MTTSQPYDWAGDAEEAEPLTEVEQALIRLQTAEALAARVGRPQIAAPIDIGVLRTAVRISQGFEAVMNQESADDDAWVGAVSVQLLDAYTDVEVGRLSYNHDTESFDFYPTTSEEQQ